MNTGLLWYDDDPKRSLAAKLEVALRRYCTRFQGAPNACHLHPSHLPLGAPRFVAGMRLIPDTQVLKDHYWLGVEDQLQPS